MRASEASFAVENPDDGARTGAALSSSVPNSESVPSRLSITSISRLCSGQSMCDAVLICQKPWPWPPLKNVTLFAWVCPAT